MDKQRVYEIAENAVRKLAEEKGPSVVFPFDLIWKYADEEVPSTQRPGASRWLVQHGHVETTGRMVNAVTPSRAGSLTPEYSLGFRFRGLTTEVVEGRISEPSPSDLMLGLEKAFDSRGYIVTASQLANFYLALMTSPLVILAGTSGTGKSWIPRVFAELIGAEFTPICVQPQWSDNADLFGYTSSLAPDVFVQCRFTTTVIAASNKPDRPSIVLLDEMNLAPVEHYFSDFLSIVETRRLEGGTLTTDSLPLDLPRHPETGTDPYAALREMSLPPNVRVVGTANMDETTRSFSPKVLDRAFSIEFDDVDLTAFCESQPEPVAQPDFSAVAQLLADPARQVSVHAAYRESQALFDHVAQMLEEIKNILRPAGISFGYRTRDAVCLYLHHWHKDELSKLISPQSALDLCIYQKILPKIKGTGDALRKALEGMKDWLSQTEAEEIAEGQVEEHAQQQFPRRPCLRSLEKIENMIRRLDDEGATSFWSI